MPLGAFKLNAIAKLLSTGPVETVYSPGWYNYGTDSGQNNTSFVGTHQIAVMGHNSDFTIRGVAAFQPRTETKNYLLPFKWNYSDNTWTIGTRVLTQDSPTDYTGFTGRKAVSELYPTSAGTVDATNYGAHYIPGNLAEQRLWIPFSVDAAGAITTYTGTNTGSPSIGTSAESGDLVYAGVRNSLPTYAFFTREDAGNNTISTFTRDGNVFTKIPGINSFGPGNRATVESADINVSGAKVCFIVINQSGQLVAVRVNSDNTYSISTTLTTGFTNKVTAANIFNSATTSIFAVCGQLSDTLRWAVQTININWGTSPSNPSASTLNTFPNVFDTTSNTPDLGNSQNMRIVKGWAENHAMVFYLRSGVLYGRYGRRNTQSNNHLVLDTEQTFVSMADARSFDVCPVYIDSTHRYFIGMINNSPGENSDGDMNLFAVRAQEITVPTALYNVSINSASVNEGSVFTFRIHASVITNGATLYWTVDHISSATADFSAENGSVVTSFGEASVNITATADITTEGPQTFRIQVRTGSITGPVVATSPIVTINDTSTPPIFAVSAAGGVTSVNEGSSLTFNVTGSSINNGTYYWTTNPTTDFSSGFQGSFTITSNSGSFSVTPFADTTTEGPETFVVEIRTDSTSGPVVATSSTITINDTSLTAVTSMTYVNAAFTSSNTANITLSASAQTGDIAILYDVTLTTTNNTVPSGWTQIVNQTTTGIRTIVSYRILTAGQAGTTITGTATNSRKFIAVYRGNIPINTATVTVRGQQATTGTPSSQSLTGEEGPMIAYAVYSATQASITTRGWSVGTSLELGTTGGPTIYSRHLITDSGTPSTTSITQSDNGSNVMASFRIKFA
jgi:hypothetical protein